MRLRPNEPPGMTIVFTLLSLETKERRTYEGTVNVPALYGEVHLNEVKIARPERSIASPERKPATELPETVTKPGYGLETAQFTVTPWDRTIVSMLFMFVQFNGDGIVIWAPLIAPTSAPPEFVKLNRPPAAGMKSGDVEPCASLPSTEYTSLSFVIVTLLPFGSLIVNGPASSNVGEGVTGGIPPDVT